MNEQEDECDEDYNNSVKSGLELSKFVLRNRDLMI